MIKYILMKYILRLQKILIKQFTLKNVNEFIKHLIVFYRNDNYQ